MDDYVVDLILLYMHLFIGFLLMVTYGPNKWLLHIVLLEICFFVPATLMDIALILDFYCIIVSNCYTAMPYLPSSKHKQIELRDT